MAEQIVNDFTVNRSIEDAWPIICDIERITPCLPGAQLEEIEGDVYRGKVKVKLGPVSNEFKGQAEFVERDDEQRRAKLVAKGRELKGRGNASADVIAEAEELSPTSTRCTVTVDLHITGKVAQYGGRGIMADVSRKLMDQFSSNLNEMLDNDAVDEAAGAATTADPPTVDGRHPRVRRIDGPAAAPVDAADLAGSAVLKRVVPLALVGIVLALFLRRRR